MKTTEALDRRHKKWDFVLMRSESGEGLIGVRIAWRYAPRAAGQKGVGTEGGEGLIGVRTAWRYAPKAAGQKGVGD